MTKKPALPAIAAMSLSISLLAASFGTVFAGETPSAQAPAASMMQGGKGGMMSGEQGGMGMMMSPELMQQRQEMMVERQEMMRKHMATMENHLADIETLLRELVELNKAKK